MRIQTSVLPTISLVVIAAACSKAKSADGNAPSEQKVVAPAAASAFSARQLIDFSLHADASDSWKLEKALGGVTFSTLDDMVTITKDPEAPGLKLDTLEDEKRRVEGPRQDEKEETLSDGWLWSYSKLPGLFGYDAVVYRTINAQPYRCLVLGSTAARQRQGIAICKSLRP